MKAPSSRIMFIALCCVASFSGTSTFANTLDLIAKSRVIKVGVREGAFPFAFFNESGKPAGYTVDLCNGVVEEIKTTLKLQELKIEYVPVKSAERLPYLLEGKIDLECGSSSNTRDRQTKVGVSYNIFYASVRMLSRKQAGFESWNEISARKVALQKGSTTVPLFQGALFANVKNSISIVDVGSPSEGYAAVAKGVADIFVSDDVLLYSQISANNANEDMQVTGRPLSVEPYAILMRKEDNAMRAVVNKALVKTFTSGEIFNIYNKWMQTSKLKIPMSNLLKESIKQPSDFHAYPW